MIQNLRKAVLLLLASVGLVLASTAAKADPPYRVARLSYMAGGVSFSPGGETDWSHAVVNRPLINGDRLWVADRSRAELQLGGTAIRVGDESSVAILNVDDRMAQLQLTQGQLDIRVARLDPNQVVEVDTPNLAVVIRQPGSYRIEVDAQDSSTGVTVRAGTALLYGEGRGFRIGPSDTWRFYDTRLADYDTYRGAALDDLARWSAERDRRWERSASARYVSRDMIGIADLDDNGTWRQVPQYGWVWTPTRVSAQWAPYREGHWSWVEPWGWTWVDDQPWGFAPSHYGRWAYLQDRWSWVPGPVNSRPVYAPALVAFIGGAAISAAVSGNNIVGWFPLAPREVYRPSYVVTRDYFTRVNVSNTVINVSQVTNVYNTRNVTTVYVNQRVPNAVIAVPAQAFVQARPVAREVVRVQAQNIKPQAFLQAAPVAPAKTSVMGAQPAQQRPPEQAFRRQVVAQTAPPPPHASIESRQGQSQANLGQPVAAASAPARGQTNAAAPAAPAVKVVQPTQAASAPPPPAAAPASRAQREERREQREQKRGERDRNAPRGEAPASAPAPAAPAAASAPAPARGPGAASAPAPARGPGAASAPAPAPASAPAPARGPAAASAPAPAAPAAASAPDRGRGDERQRGRPDLGRPGAQNAPASAPAPATATTPPAAAAAPAPVAPTRAQEAASARDQRREQPAPSPAARPAPAATPAAPQTAPAPAATPAPAPAARPSEAAQPAPREQRQQQQQQQREERQQQRQQQSAPTPAPAQREAAPAPAPAPREAAPAQRPAPAQPAPQAAPAPTPPAATGRPASPPPAAAPAAAAEQRRERASERRQAASEAREERGRRP